MEASMNMRVENQLVRQETRLCVAANRWGHRSAVRNYFAAASRLGDGVFWYVLMGAIVLVRGLQGHWLDGLGASAHMAATGVAALFLYRWLKHRTRRRRPFADDARIAALVPVLDEFSFPSGHTLHAVAFTLVALGHYPMLAWLLIPFSASVAASRVVLGVHYPSDVLAATAIGTLIASVSLWLVPGATLLG
jgi:undecaprenyl-diphosphatase